MSTAYSQKVGQILEERAYKPDHDPLKIIRLVQLLDAKLLEQITPEILNGHSNTYTFTKALAEDLLQKFKHDLPIAVVRPAIVLCSLQEPMPGYTESMHGPNGLSHAGAHGFVKVVLCDGSFKTGYVPVDHVVNASIAVIRERGLQPKSDQIDPLPFYNIIDNDSGATWDEALEYGMDQMRWRGPYSKLMWFPLGINIASIYLWYFYSIFLHYIPSVLIDLIALLSGNRPL